MKCDLHIHSNWSDGKLNISEIVDLYGSRGFKTIAITDHICEQKHIIGKISHHLNYSLSQKNFSAYISSVKQEAARAWHQYKMLVLPGFEITKNSFANRRSAHILVLGVEKFISPDLTVKEILQEAKSQGGLTIAAHPFHTGDFEFQTFHLWSRREELRELIDVWEVNYRKKISADVLDSGLPLIANSDFHHRLHFSSWKTNIYSEQNQEALFHSIRTQKLDFFLDTL